MEDYNSLKFLREHDDKNISSVLRSLIKAYVNEKILAE
jgi:hypothetical protein